MKWYYKILGGHTHVRVFMNGTKCGDLCFRNEEFEVIKKAEIEGRWDKNVPDFAEFINEGAQEKL